MRLSITLRLALLFAATTAAVLLALGLFIGQLVDRHFEELDLAELTGKLELTRHALASVRREADLQALPVRLDDALVGHHSVSVAIETADGKRLYQSHHAVALPPALLANPGADTPAYALGWEHDGRRYRAVSALAPSGIPGQAPLLVAVVLDLEHHAGFTATFRTALWAAVATAILLASLLGWLIARRGLAPVRSIAGVARGISAERLHDRLAIEEVPAELIELVNAFNEMLSRLEDSFRRLSDFSSDIAHELRTPVSNLLTQTQVGLSKSRSSEEYREILASNSEELERLSRMIADMLFLAKADNQLIVPFREEVDLRAEIESLLEFYAVLAEEKSIRITCGGQVTLNGDRLMLRRAIGNVLSNAIRHTPDGGYIRIELRQTEGRGVLLSIENSGETIPAEHLPRLFDRFYRADPSRHREGEGTGLGLAITRSIVHAHDGEVSVSSTSGVTCFSIRWG